VNAKKVAALGAGALLVATGLAAPTVTAAGAERGTMSRYSNCTELNRDFKHGVSDRRMTKRQWIRKGATAKGAYKPKLYRAVKSSMDRDKDHIACEK
jgi:hypothetical protein